MDHSTKSIAEFAVRLDYADLPAEVVHDCKRRIIDTIGCAIAAFDDEPSRIARAVALRAEVANGASVIGTPHRTLPELAAFANSVASRYLEGNDTYPGGGGHPNDNLLPILAIAQPMVSMIRRLQSCTTSAGRSSKVRRVANSAMLLVL